MSSRHIYKDYIKRAIEEELAQEKYLVTNELVDEVTSHVETVCGGTLSHHTLKQITDIAAKLVHPAIDIINARRTIVAMIGG